MLTIRTIATRFPNLLKICSRSISSAKGLLEHVREKHGFEQYDDQQSKFMQIYERVHHSLEPLLESDSKYLAAFDYLSHPEQSHRFRVAWMDDNQQVQINTGWRVQWSSALGPYKGGLRFHKTVTEDTLKFLAFEQVFKNALTTLPMGGAKGGSDFDPTGRSDEEIMRFCQSFMTALFRHIGPDLDVPAGDINVGGREIGYLFGQYKKLSNSFTGVITGKGKSFGGSELRPEATGYGLMWYTVEMLKNLETTFEGKRCLVSGSGNVAQYSVDWLIDAGAKPLTFSDSTGGIYEPDGFTREQWAWIMELKNVREGRIHEYLEYSDTAIDLPSPQDVWKIEADFAFPCACENEIDGSDAQNLVDGGVYLVAEGANMPCNDDAIDIFYKNEICYATGKASNAGGVACSGLEMSQNSQRFYWTREEVSNKLEGIMQNVYQSCYQTSLDHDFIQDGDLYQGANVAAFLKIADAVEAQGCI